MVATKTPTRPVSKKASAAPAKKPAAPVKASQTVKPVKTTAPAPNKTAVKVSDKASKKKDKPEKVKVVRDSFTIPKTEFTQIAEMKKRAMALGVEVKKSELIRAGLQLMTGLQDAAFKKALAAVPTLKTGRPAKD